MSVLEPMWIDVTWGAGGSTSDRTIEICETALNKNGLTPMMHLTCTNMHKQMIDDALNKAKDLGIKNILALRGDPPNNEERWVAAEGGFCYATDLVRYIRQEHGDYFCIAVAGYPEGHPQCDSKEADMMHLKEKIDAGANLIVTQLFYDVDLFLKFIDDCHAMNIHVPVLPGMMPILSKAGFDRMVNLCKVNVPEHVRALIDAAGDDETALKDAGVKIVEDMCRKIISSGKCPGLHFYTLNLEASTTRILQGVNLISEERAQQLLNTSA